MFELSVAFKYLIPRWRQLSVSIISLISTLVIALVVWLIVVFFSVKDGLESSWIEKIIALTAPVRLTPTEQYHHSYYSLIDTISSNSDYTAKTIGEKLAASATDPYDAANDEEIPKGWPKPDTDTHGNLKDIVKMAVASANELPGFKGIVATDFETTVANLRVRLLRQSQNSPSQQFLEHAAFLGSFDANTPAIARALIPPTAADFNNLLQMQGISTDNIQEDSPGAIHRIAENKLQQHLESFFKAIEVTALKVPPHGWRLPATLLPGEVTFAAGAIMKDGKIIKVYLPTTVKELDPLIEKQKGDGWDAFAAELKVENSVMTIKLLGKDSVPLAHWTPILLDADHAFKAQLVESSLSTAKTPSEVKFDISGNIQGAPFAGTVALGTLEIAAAHLKSDAAAMPLAYSLGQGIAMPVNSISGDPVLLPRGFKESGALIGDHGYLSYYSPTPSSVQEQRIPIFIAGFYDPGIIPIGGKFILASRELTALIRASSNQDQAQFTNGLNVRFDTIAEAPKVKAELQKALERAGIAPYWKVTTYQEYEFTKDIVQQLQSEKNLFSLISLVIIVVACSNIISMLIILVNDKKLEIGILRSMGATSGSIAAIFGICGMVMGAMGSIVGIVAALLTLRYVNELVGLISRVQGYDLFNPVFYGHTLPSELSTEALTLVIITTACISLLAGIVPAVKACMMRPSAILKAE